VGGLVTLTAWATVIVLGLSVVVLAFAIANLVRTVRMNQTTRWAILRTQVYNNKSLEAQRQVEASAEALLKRLKELNGE
jgi:hypothetical protein